MLPTYLGAPGRDEEGGAPNRQKLRQYDENRAALFSQGVDTNIHPGKIITVVTTGKIA